jgi:hypothetical protein
MGKRDTSRERRDRDAVPEGLALQNFTESTRSGKCPALAFALQAIIAMEGGA